MVIGHLVPEAAILVVIPGVYGHSFLLNIPLVMERKCMTKKFISCMKFGEKIPRQIQTKTFGEKHCAQLFKEIFFVKS